MIRRLGAETVEHAVRRGDAIAGAHVRDLGLPREALVSVIVRDHEALAPRGSTRIRAGDRLHVLVRHEAADAVDALQERWRRGPVGAPPRPRRRLRGSSPIFTVRPAGDDALAGALDAPERVLGRRVVALLRVRRDRPGALVALEDGRYAVTGPVIVAGSRDDVTTHARRRARSAGPTTARGCRPSSARSRSTSSTGPRYWARGPGARLLRRSRPRTPSSPRLNLSRAVRDSAATRSHDQARRQCAAFLPRRCSTATTIAPTRTPRIAEAVVLISQPITPPPASSSRWWTKS